MEPDKPFGNASELSNSDSPFRGSGKSDCEQLRDDLDALLGNQLSQVRIPPGLKDRISRAVNDELTHSFLTALSPSEAQVSSDTQLSAGKLPVKDLPSAEMPNADRMVGIVLANASLGQGSNDRATNDRAGRTEGNRGWVRRAVLVGSLAAVFGLIAVLGKLLLQEPERSWLATECSALLEEMEQSPQQWTSVAQADTSLLVEPRSSLVPMRVLGSRGWMVSQSALRGRAYRLDAGDGVGIIVLELDKPRSVAGVSSRFEALATPSGGWSLAAMARGGKLFVLAVPGTQRQLERYLRQASLT